MAEKEWPPKEEFADRFARLRRHKGLDNAAIAKATGVIPKTVSMWAGGQEPKGASLLALAELFEVTPRYLLTGKGPRAARRNAVPIEQGSEEPSERPTRKRGKGASA